MIFYAMKKTICTCIAALSFTALNSDKAYDAYKEGYEIAASGLLLAQSHERVRASAGEIGDGGVNTGYHPERRAQPGVEGQRI